MVKDKESYVDTGYMINTAMMDYVESKKKIKANDYSKTSEILTLQK